MVSPAGQGCESSTLTVMSTLGMKRIDGKQSWVDKSEPWGFLSIAFLSTGQAQVWAKLHVSQLRRQSSILPLKRQGIESYVAWEGMVGIAVGQCWRKEDGGW